MDTTLTLVGVAVAAFLVLIVALMAAIKAFWVVPNADEALVRTGTAQPTVSTGGILVIPLIHRVTRVGLRAVRIPIVREGENALPTSDKIPAELRGELIVRVSPDDPGHVILAAQAIGHHEGSMERVIQDQIDSLVTDALRTAAFQKTFLDLNSKKKEFADEVQQLIAEDLGKLGLTLTAVTIPHIKQGNFTSDAGDVFAAEGQRNVAETVAKARQETNKITREAEITVQEQDVSARKRALALEQEQKQLEADQQLRVTEYQAQRETEKQKTLLEQEQSRAMASAEQHRTVETARIQQDQQVQAARIEQEKAIAVTRALAEAERKAAEEEAGRRQQEAEIARRKAVEAAEIEKERAITVADEARLQAVAEAEIAKQVAIAQKKEEEASARAKQALAEAEQRRAEQAITTVQATAAAERDRAVVLVKAEEEAGRARIAADRDAYVATKAAEALRDATKKRAEAAHAEASGRGEALLIQAKAEADARTVRAAAEAEAAAKESAARIELARAVETEGRARAEAERALVDAKNVVDPKLLMRDVALEALKVAPDVVRELMAPVAKVADVKVLQVQGLGGGTGDGANLPATILGSGLAVSGVLPLLRQGVQALMNNPELGAIGQELADAGRAAVTGTVAAVADGLRAPATSDAAAGPPALPVHTPPAS